MYADDDTRVHLKEVPDVEGSDYINASFIEVKSTVKGIFALFEYIICISDIQCILLSFVLVIYTVIICISDIYCYHLY